MKSWKKQFKGKKMEKEVEQVKVVETPESLEQKIQQLIYSAGQYSFDEAVSKAKLLETHQQIINSRNRLAELQKTEEAKGLRSVPKVETIVADFVPVPDAI